MLVLIDADKRTRTQLPASGAMRRTSTAGGTAGASAKLIHFGGDIFTTADQSMTRDPDVGPRFLFLADSIRLSSECVATSLWES